MTDIVLVLTTVPAGERAELLARTLVDERLAACVNVYPPMVSLYRWRGVIERDSEQQIVIKTAVSRVPDLRARLSGLHPYELPELLILEVSDGSPDYLQWVAAETEGGGRT
jgi:periplasmic divalent cation tolerance protein